MATGVPIETSKLANVNFLVDIAPNHVQDHDASLKLRRIIFATFPQEFKEMLFPSTHPKKLAQADLKEIYRSNINVRRVINIFIRDADDYLDEITYSLQDIRRRKLKDDRKDIVRDLKKEHIR
jgi:hypothetical protein